MRSVTKKLVRATLCVAAMAIRPSPVATGPLEAGLFVGTDTINSDDDVGARAAGDDLRVAGLRAALGLGARLEVELESKLGTASEEDRPLLWGWRAHGLFKLNPRAPVRLFLLGGGGGETALEGSGTDFMLQLGAGAKVDVGSRVGFRIDGRQLFTRIDSTFVPSYELHFGAYFRFGSAGAPARGEELEEQSEPRLIVERQRSGSVASTAPVDDAGEPALPPGLEEEKPQAPAAPQPSSRAPAPANEKAPDRSGEGASEVEEPEGADSQEVAGTGSDLEPELPAAEDSPTVDVPRKVALVVFDHRRKRLKSKARHGLDQALRIIEKHPEQKIEVIGYAADAARERTNRWLSRTRAKVVKAYLVRRGVAAGRIAIKGDWSRNPRSAARKGTSRSRDRRVDVRLVASER